MERPLQKTPGSTGCAKKTSRELQEIVYIYFYLLFIHFRLYLELYLRFFPLQQSFVSLVLILEI